MQTQSEENYLKAIFHLYKQGTDKISITALASLLGNNPASVIEMLKKLEEKKLILYNKVQGVKLKPEGIETAILVIRKHRLWEMFLQEKLGYTWDEVHEIAEQLEHVKDEKLADRLDKFLGFPEFDPHGEPIPSSDGKFPNVLLKTLSDIKPGDLCEVISVKDTSKTFLQYLHKLNIGIGTKIKVIEKQDFDNSIFILFGDQKISVSKKFAESLQVS